MALEITNVAESTLDGGINDSVTALDVVSASSFPTSGTFWINVENEIMKVTGVSTNTFTVVRGEAGGGATAAAAHSSGVTVTQVVGSQSVTQLRADLTRWGSYSTFTGLTDMKAGDVFHFTSGTAYSHAVYSGSAWLYFYRGIKCVPMNTGSFAFSSAVGSPSAATNGGVVEITGPAFSTTRHLYETTYPTAPFTLRVVMRAEPLATDPNWAQGLGIRESGTDEHVVHLLTPSTSDRLVATWTNKTTFGSSLATANRETTAHYQAFIMEYEDDTTNRFYRFSYDGGKVWQDYTELTSVFLTPDKIGVALLNLVSGGPHWVYVYSWEVT